jgi:hypothetical protein
VVVRETDDRADMGRRMVGDIFLFDGQEETCMMKSVSQTRARVHSVVIEGHPGDAAPGRGQNVTRARVAAKNELSLATK